MYRSHFTVFNGNGFIANTAHFPNFGNTGLIALTQWQYWWWFWFTFLLTLYFILTLRILYTRTLSLHPKITTSLRSHGRWGDLIICAVPIFWCLNILTNSHFLLRHLEWQTENSLFTLRVRGKQWYWVYKFDLKGHYDINTAHVILGRNKKIQAIRSDPNKWSIMSMPTQGVYTLRDRASDPFEKINHTAVRSKNPNLYNRVQIKPGNIKHVTKMSEALLSRFNTNEVIKNKKVEESCLKADPLYAMGIWTAFGEDFHKFAEEYGRCLAAVLHKKQPDQPTWVLWLRFRIQYLNTLYIKIWRQAYEQLAQTKPIKEQARKHNSIAAYYLAHRWMMLARSNAPVEAHLHQWKGLGGTSDALRIESKTLPYLADIKKTVRTLIVRKILSSYAQELAFYIRTSQIWKKFIHDLAKGLVGKYRGMRESVTIATTLPRALSPKRLIYFGPIYSNSVLERLQTQNLVKHITSVNYAMDTVFANHLRGVKISKLVEAKFHSIFDAQNKYYHEWVVSTLESRFHFKYYIFKPKKLNAVHLAKIWRKNLFLQKLATKASLVATKNTHPLFTTRQILSFVQGYATAKRYINCGLFLPSKTFTVVQGVEFKKLLAIDHIRKYLSAFTFYSAKKVKGALRVHLVQRCSIMANKFNDLWFNKTKIVNLSYGAYLPHASKTQPTIGFGQGLNIVINKKLITQGCTVRFLQKALKETTQTLLRDVARVRLYQRLSGEITTVGCKENRCRPLRDINAIFGRVVFAAHSRSQKELWRLQDLFVYSHRWVFLKERACKKLYYEPILSGLRTIKLSAFKKLRLFTRSSRRCSAHQDLLQHNNDVFFITQALRGLSLKKVERGLRILWTLKINHARKLGLTSLGRQTVFGSLRRYIRKRAAIKQVILYSRTMRNPKYLLQPGARKVYVFFIDKYLNTFLHKRWWHNNCPKCHAGIRVDARLRVKLRKWFDVTPRWKDLRTIWINPKAFLYQEIVKPLYTTPTKAINKPIVIGTQNLNLGEMKKTVPYLAARQSIIIRANPVWMGVYVKSKFEEHLAHQYPRIEEYWYTSRYFDRYKLNNSYIYEPAYKSMWASSTYSTKIAARVLTHKPTTFSPQWINLYYPTISNQPIPVLKPLTKHRWIKNQFTPNNLIQLFRYNKEGAASSKQLLKLKFTNNTDQVRDLNENVKITYIQKKTEPVTFTTGLRKYETVFDNKNLYREFDTVVTGHEDVTYQKLRIRKDKENLLSLKKKQAFRREIQHSKRLLWVTKQIVLPIRTPITIITNSYDVIHSWFIPGLGLKMDCVPGRSTHHTIFIDKPGYYYGQCAEVCGRRHHHMPIKILAVPFVHFLYWWNKKVRNRAEEELNTRIDGQPE